MTRVSAAESNNQELQLIRIRLSDGTVRKTGPLIHLQGYELTNRRAVIPAICAGDHRVYVGTREDGIFIFSTDEPNVEHLTTAEGLPSEWVHSLAYQNGRLYAEHRQG